MSFCVKCGKRLQVSMSACPDCGATVENPLAAVQPPTMNHEPQRTKEYVMHMGTQWLRTDAPVIASLILGIVAFAFLGLFMILLLFGDMGSGIALAVFCLALGIISTILGANGYFIGYRKDLAIGGLVCGIINVCVASAMFVSMAVAASAMIEITNYVQRMFSW